MHNLRRIREHGAKDERKRILKLIDELSHRLPPIICAQTHVIDPKELKSRIQGK